MKMGPFDVKTVDDCLDVLETSIKSDSWKQLDSQEQMRLIARLDHILTSGYKRFKNPAQLVDMCLEVIQVAFLTSMWKELPQEEKTPIIGRLSYILEITERQELGE
jgi:hypothetical protein